MSQKATQWLGGLGSRLLPQSLVSQDQGTYLAVYQLSPWLCFPHHLPLASAHKTDCHSQIYNPAAMTARWQTSLGSQLSSPKLILYLHCHPAPL